MKWLCLLVWCAVVQLAHAQDVEPLVVPADSEHIPIIRLPDVVIRARMPSWSQLQANRRRQEYDRLRYAVRLTYPMALEARRVVQQLDDQLGNMKRKDRRLYTKRLEKQLFAKYEPTFREMTVSQGKVLLKLVARETGFTGYELIKDYRSSTSAILWQVVARFFGTNLKTPYDKDKEQAIEFYVRELQAEMGYTQNVQLVPRH